jgi:hypothetical protein
MHARCMAAVVALAWSCVPISSAQEKSASAGAPATTDAIAGAKKEFESIKSSRDAGLLPKAALPRVNLPEVSAIAPAVGIGTKQKIAAPEPKSSNWLVDAMEKQERPSDARGPNSRTRGRERKAAARTDDLEAGEPAARELLVAAGSEERDVPVVVNPLTQYLGDWMTPQDYSLLKPGLQSFEAGAAAKSSVGMGTPTTAGALGIGSEFVFGGIASSPSSVIAPVTRENPYLQSMKPDLVTSSVVSPKSVALPPMTAPRPGTIAPPPPAPPAPTKIPEFVKPPSDDRYFKQLKRF